METYRCVITRRAVRTYKPRPVPDKALKRILEAARRAPSARHRQPWHFIVVRDREGLRRLAASTTGHYLKDAPVALAVAVDSSNKWGDMDGARAVQNMVLVAWEMGLGSCWVANIPDAVARKVLALPKELRLLTVLPIGYPACKDLATERWKRSGFIPRRRKRLEEIASSERYGERIKLAGR